MIRRMIVAVVVVGCTGWPASGAPSRDREEMERLTGERSRLESEIETLEGDLAAADEDGAAKVQKELTKLCGDLGALLPKLHAAVIGVYKGEAKPDAALSGRIAETLYECESEDRWILASDAAEAMLAKKHPGIDLQRAGVAAFRAQRFESAAAHFAAARKLGPLEERVEKRMAAYLPDLPGQWEQEKRVREAEAKADELPRVRLETEVGNIDLELFERQAPNTVANFVHLVESGYYDGTPFHRVLNGFMMQGGDPSGTGEGGPGWSVACECYRPDYRRHFAGTLSMAHAGRDTGGSQFFITYVPTPHLDGKHTAFGRVIDGWETLTRVVKRDPSKEEELAIVPTKIIKATVLRKVEGVTYAPEKLPEKAE